MKENEGIAKSQRTWKTFLRHKGRGSGGLVPFCHRMSTFCDIILHRCLWTNDDEELTKQMEMMMEKRHLSRSSTKRSSPPKTHHRHVSWWSPLHTGIIRELFVFGADHIKPQTLISIGIVEMCTVWHWVCWVGGGQPWHWQSTDYFFEFFWFHVSAWTVLFWSPPCFLSTFLFSAQFN